MKIGILSHYFWPELGAPSARLLELGREWVARGHEVSVVTNFPNHPTGVVPEAYRGKSFLIENVDGIRVIRCRTYATPNQGFVRRTFGHLFFMTQAVWQGLAPLRGVDVLIGSSPTLFAVVAAWVLSRRLGVPFVFEVRDLWPAIFAELGVLRNRLILRLLEGLEMFLYRQSGAVVTVTRGFAEDIERRGIDGAKIHFIPNGVDLDAFQPGPPNSELLARLGLSGRFVVLYCGAHGISHALESVLDAAERLRTDPIVHFLFVGEGAEKARLVEEARRRGLANVSFRPGVPREQVPALYRSADVCLVPLRRVPLFRAFIPSKMFEILACGRPIVASVEGEAARILEESGAALVVPPEDATLLAESICRLRVDVALRETLTRRGPPFVAERYDRSELAAHYLEVLSGTRRPNAA